MNMEVSMGELLMKIGQQQMLIGKLEQALAAAQARVRELEKPQEPVAVNGQVERQAALS